MPHTPHTRRPDVLTGQMDDTSTNNNKRKETDMSTKTQTPADIIDALTTMIDQNTMEAQLLTRKLTRELYKQLGMPTEDDFPDAYNKAGYWNKFSGYTTHIDTITKQEMKVHNNSAVDYRIKRPSETKQRIIERYTRDGWHVQVQEYNVICSKFIQHPRYPKLAVFFYISRNAERYEYVIITDTEE